MLILHSSYLDSAGDLDPDGDLGTGPCPRCFSRGDRCVLDVTPVAAGWVQPLPPPAKPISLLLPGLRGRVFGSPPPPRLGGPGAPRAPASSGMEEAQPQDGQRSELDVSDLGSRNYGARTDFYCLVTEDDI